MSTQTGGEISIYDSYDNFIATPVLDEIEIKHDSGVDTAITEFTAVGDVGNEIEYIYLITGSSIAGSRKFKQGSTASTAAEITSATSDADIVFEYDPATKTITLPEGLFENESVVLAQYSYRGLGLETVSDMDHFSKTVKAVLDVSLQDMCSKEFNHGQFILPRAKVDGNFSVSVGDNPSVHEIKLSALGSTCFGQNKELFSYRIVMGEATV